MFDRTGIIEYDAKVASDDAMLEAAIDAGADDVLSSEAGHEVYASQETLRDVAKALEAKFGEARKAALIWRPQNTVAVNDDTGEKLLKLMDLLNEHDDVQNVYANFQRSPISRWSPRWADKPFFVIAGHSRSKNGVLPLAYDPAWKIHLVETTLNFGWMRGSGLS